eukprot:scaffold6145_cov71-Skeletonema_dohrnii-CCMP3373.AAC.1
MLLTRMAEEISCRAQTSSIPLPRMMIYDDVLCGLRTMIAVMMRPNHPSTTFFQSNHGGPHRKQPLAAIDSIMRDSIQKLSQPLIQSWCQKVVGGHLPLLEELIIFPEAKFTHHQLANNHDDQLASARPLFYRRLQQYSPVHIAAAPSRLTSSIVKQARRYQDDQKVSFMIHDVACAGQNEQSR